MPRRQISTSEPLLEECKNSLQTLQGALLALIKACGAEQDHAFALSQRLDMDKSLAWRIVRFAKEHDVNQAVEYLPGNSGLNIFINKCQRGSSTRDATKIAQQAAAELSCLAKRVGGSRNCLNYNCVSKLNTNLYLIRLSLFKYVYSRYFAILKIIFLQIENCPRMKI